MSIPGTGSTALATHRDARADRRSGQQQSTTDYPTMITPVNHMEPVRRRIRATVGARTILDTTRAPYVWEWPNYPQYYIPVADVDPAALVDEQVNFDHPVPTRTQTACPDKGTTSG